MCHRAMAPTHHRTHAPHAQACKRARMHMRRCTCAQAQAHTCMRRRRKRMCTRARSGRRGEILFQTVASTSERGWMNISPLKGVYEFIRASEWLQGLERDSERSPAGDVVRARVSGATTMFSVETTWLILLRSNRYQSPVPVPAAVLICYYVTSKNWDRPQSPEKAL